MQDEDGSKSWEEWDQLEEEPELIPPRESRGIKLAAAGFFAAAVFAGVGWWLWQDAAISRTSEEYVQEAQAHLDSGSGRSASIELKNALQQNSENTEARFLLGKLYFDSGDVASAEKELGRAQELGKDPALVVPLLARVYLALGKNRELQALEVEALPTVERATVLAAQGLGQVNAGNAAEGAGLINQALRAAPENELVMLTQARLLLSKEDLIGARAQVNAILELNAQNSDALVLLGDIELLEGGLDAAEAAYSRAMEFAKNPNAAQIRRAQVRIEKQDFEQAQADVTQLLARSPNNPVVHTMQGVIHFENQDFQGAVASLAAAGKGGQQKPLALLYAGVSHYQLGNINQAAEYAIRFQQQAPNNLHGQRLLALVEIARGDYPAAEKAIRPAVATNPDDPAALNLLARTLLAQGNSEEGIEVLSRVAELQPGSSDAQFRLGAGKLLVGEVDAGTQRLESALAMNPESQQADMLLVLNHLRQKDYENAISAAEDYRARNPASARPYSLLGRVYQAAEQPGNARRAFLDALEIDPGQAAANHSLAEMAMSEGDFSAAKARYDAVLNAHENYLPTLLKLAAMAGRQKDEKTMVAYLQRAMEQHPYKVSPRLLMGRYHLSAGKPQQVAPLFSELDEDLQNQPGVLNLVGLAQLAAKDYRAAKYTFEKRAEMPPDTAQLHYQLARVYAGLDEPRRAELELEKALQLVPDHVPSRYMLVRQYLSAGDAEQAQPHLAKLRERNPDSPHLQRLEAAYATLRGDEQKSLEFLEKAHRELPASTTLFQLVEALDRRGESAKKQQLLEEWLSDHPGDSRARMSLALALEADSAAAVPQYEQVLEREQDNVMALNNLAWHLRESEPERALVYAQRARKLAPNSAGILDTLAIVQLNNGELDSARRTISSALFYNSSDPGTLYHSALISAAAGDRESAIAVLGPLLDSGETFPDREAAQALLQQLGSGG